MIKTVIFLIIGIILILIGYSGLESGSAFTFGRYSSPTLIDESPVKFYFNVGIFLVLGVVSILYAFGFLKDK